MLKQIDDFERAKSGNRRVTSMAKAKRIGTGLNTATAIMLAGLLAMLLNYISFKHWNIRKDMTSSQRAGLSAGTRYLLENLTNELEIIMLASRQHEQYEEAERLLREVKLSTGNISVEITDPGLNFARARELAVTYGIAEPNSVIIVYEGRTKTLLLDEMLQRKTETTAGLPRDSALFEGEYALAAAIKSLLDRQDPVVYFLAGHGEGRIDDYDQYSGLSVIARSLHREGIKTETLFLGAQKAIPKNCDALIIVGLTKPLSIHEAEAVKLYLQGFGRLLLMADAGAVTGLEEMLLDWGVQLSSDRVVGATLTGRDLVLTDYGKHAVTRRLKNVRTVLVAPRSVVPVLPDADDEMAVDRPAVTALAMSGKDSWAEMTAGQNPPIFDEGVDRRGPVPVAVAVERGDVKRMAVELKPAKMVVIGDAGMVANGALLSGYGDGLFLGALRWLLDRDPSIATANEGQAEAPLVLTVAERRFAFWIAAIGAPAVAALLAAMAWLARRG